ncbi:uncharacterized protein I206_103781 [Kwoniella pini CBS 10737]|uniref:Uncharacterized protein n=1 Tax=Kwoniella pini CBS 10737 TaxID=1296096 RepID=A0A1B9HSK1_9TREE|nr:uncharacterized protein I206_07730 [Kwoniella pini CBS 10737]OCF46253.1 hypothetical protein I206_07730 [Kwoniella pini CBS 10737]
MVDRSIYTPPTIRINIRWDSLTSTLIILISLSTIACIYRLVKETNRGRTASRQSEKKSDHRIEQSPRRHEPKLEALPPYTKEKSASESGSVQEERDAYASEFPDLTKAADLASESDRSRMVKDKELYHKLQNYEDHLDVIEEARCRLIELFDQTLSESLVSPSDTILNIPSYDPTSLRDFLHNSHRIAANKYEAYVDRRKSGGPREMFPTREYALEWVRLAGVVKYVDGGWIGGILIGTGKSTSNPRGLCTIQETRQQYDNAALEREVSKMAWQVISEEFGDGDLEKNHIYLYEKLLNDTKLGAIQSNGKTAPGDIRGFDGLEEDQGVPRCWEAAVAQQCIGLLASTREFFPEALGFNLAYESLPYHLLVTARELIELKIDNYYFAIHVTIDNADSGHSAMARLAVERYLEGIRQREGEEVMQVIWKRIQVGYILAEGLPTTPSGPVEFEQVLNNLGQLSWRPRKEVAKSATRIEKRLSSLIIKKSRAAEKMHCTSRMKVGNLSIEEWLDPDSISEGKVLDFLRILSNKRPFVIKGEPERSRFMRDLEWGGKMFGAFTGSEVHAVKDWIMSLKPKSHSQGTYHHFTGHTVLIPDTAQVDNRKLTPFEIRAQDLRTLHDSSTLPPTSFDESLTADAVISRPIKITSLDYSKIRPIWYISTSLFECFQLQPSKFAAPLGMLTLRLFRSILGFGALHLREDICAGTDDLLRETQNDDLMGIWELGEILDRASGIMPPTDVIELARNTPVGKVNDICAKLLDLRIKPYKNVSLLFGISLALSKNLYSNISINELLTDMKGQSILKRITEEQIAIISDYVRNMKDSSDSENWEKEFIQGYLWAEAELSTID